MCSDPRHLCLAGTAAALLSACGQDSRLSIEIITPSLAELDPTLDDRLALLRQVDENHDVILAEQPFHANEPSVALPHLPIGFRGDLRLDLLDSGGRALGVGRTRDASLTLDKGTVMADTKLRFYVRKPLAYVGSDKEVRVADITRPRPEEMALAALPVQRVTALAPLRNGRMVLMATDGGSNLVGLDTRDHTTAALFEAPAAIRRIIVDPADRSAVLLSDVAMTSFALPGQRVQSRPSTQPIANLGAAAAAFAVDGNSVFVVTQTTSGDCAKKSLLQRRSPVGMELSSQVTLPVAVSDLDIHPATGNPIVASPCRGQILEIDPDTGSVKGVVLDELPGVSEVAVVRKLVLGIASNTAGGAPQLEVKRWPSPAETVRLPWPTTLLIADDTPTTKALIEIKPSGGEIRDAAAADDLDHVVLAVRLDYLSDRKYCDGITLTQWGTVTVGLAGRTLAFIATKNEVKANAMACSIKGGIPPAQAYEPTTVAVLFGGS